MLAMVYCGCTTDILPEVHDIGCDVKEAKKESVSGFELLTFTAAQAKLIAECYERGAQHVGAPRNILSAKCCLPLLLPWYPTYWMFKFCM
jgi:hypothetical protein